MFIHSVIADNLLYHTSQASATLQFAAGWDRIVPALCKLCFPGDFDMEKIASFTINHEVLLPGLYVSRLDRCGDTFVTTFDLRFTAPNREPVMNTAPIHTIEHLGATFLRNSSRKDEILYFGPMGCRTGFYLLMSGNLSPENILPLMEEMCDFILSFEGEIPGAKPEECGNYLDQNLAIAKFYAARYRDALKEKRFVYPE